MFNICCFWEALLYLRSSILNPTTTPSFKSSLSLSCLPLPVALTSRLSLLMYLSNSHLFQGRNPMFRAPTMYQALCFHFCGFTYIPDNKGRGDIILQKRKLKLGEPKVTWLLNDQVGLRPQSVWLQSPLLYAVSPQGASNVLSQPYKSHGNSNSTWHIEDAW